MHKVRFLRFGQIPGQKNFRSPCIKVGLTGKLTGFVTSLTSYFTRHMCHTPINISEVLSYYKDGGDVVRDRGDYITAQRIHLDGDTTIADNIFEYEV